MPSKSRFVIAQSSIKSYFLKNKQKVFSMLHLQQVLDLNRLEWNLPVSMSLDKFAKKLVDTEVLMMKEIKATGSLGAKIRYIHPDASIFQIALSLVNKSHLSHYTAAHLLGLTTQVPKTVYLTFEQSPKSSPSSQLTQAAIDSAFAKPQRKSNTEATIDGTTILVLNSANSNAAGVISLDGTQTTNIERTLIDVTVRPNYAGGVYSVLEMYERALEKISINKLLALLNRLKFTYPYQQSIGFYLEKAGYNGRLLDEIRGMKSKFNFYLTYEMEEKDYSPDWGLYYPKGM